LAIFTGLTLFTFQSKVCFTHVWHYVMLTDNAPSMTSLAWAHGSSVALLLSVRRLLVLDLSCADVLNTVGTGLVGVFIPFGHTMELVYSAGGAVIFSGYIGTLLKKDADIGR
jgi:FtsH-binding integral membrane protein